MPSTTSISAALKEWRVWTWFALRDVKSRYRGSFLGPVWLVLNLAFFVGALSLVFGAVLGQPLHEFAPYVTGGLVAWWFVSQAIPECCNAFINERALIRNLPLPLGVHVLCVVTKHVIFFAHNMVVFVVVALIFRLQPGWNTLLVIPGFALVATLLVSAGLCLAIICARYRDIPHFVANLMTVGMLVTPIMFMKSMLGPRAAFANYNPFYHMVQGIRAPLLNEAPSLTTWVFLVAANVTFGFFAWWLLRRAGQRVAYLV
jgi:ABC-type polysaccharide/polyol phosphate export permease